jgi:hypothetical protein
MEKFGPRFWANAMLPGFFVGLLIIGLGYLAPITNFNLAAGTYITGIYHLRRLLWLLCMSDMGAALRGLFNIPPQLWDGDVVNPTLLFSENLPL